MYTVTSNGQSKEEPEIQGTTLVIAILVVYKTWPLEYNRNKNNSH